jgi:hypothetical protein
VTSRYKGISAKERGSNDAPRFLTFMAARATCSGGRLRLQRRTEQRSRTGRLLTHTNLQVPIFWDTAPCSRYINRLFGGIYHLRFHGQKSAEQDSSMYQVVRLLAGLFLAHLNFALKMKVIYFFRNACSHMAYAALHTKDGNFW